MERSPLSPHRQRQLQVCLLGAFTVFFGLSIVWSGLRGSWTQFLSKFALMLVALMLGKLTGHVLRIQRCVNKGAGRFASNQLSPDQAVSNRSFSDVFVACAAVYCLAPWALLGSLAEGLHRDLRPLIIKRSWTAWRPWRGSSPAPCCSARFQCSSGRAR